MSKQKLDFDKEKMEVASLLSTMGENIGFVVHEKGNCNANQWLLKVIFDGEEAYKQFLDYLIFEYDSWNNQ